ncbi:MAG: helix-turn-helix domain-containing protein [Muribaculaceae bacterium]
MIKGKAGIVLCTSGTREILISGWLHKIDEGTILMVSPMIPLIEVSRGADYTELQLLADFDVIYPIVKTVISREFIIKVRNNPYIVADNDDIELFIKSKDAIDSLRCQLNSIAKADEIKILEQLLRLKFQETILMFYYRFYKSLVLGNVGNYRKVDIVVSRFAFLVSQYFSENRSVEYYAGQLNISPSHLTRLVKKCIGRTPSEWIASVTVVNAKLLLMQNDMSIKEIAEALHFPEQYTFRKYFKHHVGVSPKEFRLQSKRNS